MAVDGEGPRVEYARRLAERQAGRATLRRREALLSASRAAIFVAGAVLAWPIAFTRSIGWLWWLVPGLLFLAAAVLHERLIRRRVALERAIAFYERAIERIEDRWVGRGASGEAFGSPDHPYAQDLDVFGTGSLFQRICAARTSSGEATLAAWLSAGAESAEVRRRQAAVRELRDALDFREDLAVLGEPARGAVDARALAAWGTSPSVLGGWRAPAMAACLALANFSALGAWMLAGASGRVAFLATLAVSGAFALVLRPRVRRILGGVDQAHEELELLRALLARIEREPFASDLLRELRSGLDLESAPPSRRIAFLARWVELRDSRRNMLFAPLAALLLAGTQVACGLERWRARSGASLSRWLAIVGAVEALASLAGYAYDNPADPFPEIDAEHGPRFAARGLGHPLLPAARSVPNDVQLAGALQLLLVSGSNMSGKSTLLRSVGTNVVLALAGAPVRAAELGLSRLTVGACMRVQDSLLDGTSHFYAELLRLRRIVELARDAPPALFLLDEIFHGTNSHDRRIGAEALIRSLIERDAIGLVTTHDLALARIADELAPRAENVHFEDQLDGERMRFDYRLRPGVVQKSNALALMRAVGLEV